jgi:hypothetical protein
MAGTDRPPLNPFKQVLGEAVHGRDDPLADLVGADYSQIYDRDSQTETLVRAYNLLDEPRKPLFRQAVADLITDFNVDTSPPYAIKSLLWAAHRIARTESFEPAVALLEEKLKPRLDEEDISHTGSIVVQIVIRLADAPDSDERAMPVLERWMDDSVFDSEKGLILQGLVIGNPDNFPDYLHKFFDAANRHAFPESYPIAEMTKKLGIGRIAALSHKLPEQDLSRFFKLMAAYPYGKEFQTAELHPEQMTIANPQTQEIFHFNVPTPEDEQKFERAFASLAQPQETN